MNRKKKLLFIVDKPNWAYHFIIKTWAKLLTDFECYIAYERDFQIRSRKFSVFDIIKNKISSVLQLREVQFKIDSSRRFSYPIYKQPPVYKVSNNKRVNITHFDFIIEMAYYFQFSSYLPFSSNKKIVGIYTDGYPHEGPNYDYRNNIDYKKLPREEFYNKYLKPYNGIIVGCNNIVRAYTPFTDKILFAYGIYKQEKFGVLKKNHSTFTIGWTGNPDREMKGFKEIILPAIEEVRKTGRIINLKTKHSGTYEELFSFYEDIDLVLIASRADSGPSLFAEASLSSIPCISTPIGLPEMVIQHNINGMIVERDITAFKNAIIELYDNREKLTQFSKRIKKDYLEKMSNEISIKNLTKFLNNI